MDYLHALSHSIIIKLQACHPLILAGIATVFFWLVPTYFNSGAWKLRHFPTVGSTLPLLSLIGRIQFMKNTPNVVATGRRKWPGRVFKVLAPSGWQLVITDARLLDDVRKAPEHILSANEAREKSLHTKFTFHHRVVEHPIQVPIIRTRLTKELPRLVPDVYDEVVEACNQYFPAKDEWTRVSAFESLTRIVAHASNRIFVGQTLCRNPEWIKLCITYTREVIKTVMLLNCFPPFLRPFANYFVGRGLAQQGRDGFRLLGPVLAARRNEKGVTQNPNDFLSWLMEETKGDDDETMVARLLSVNFAAIHTSSMAGTHALLDLASNPEYFKPLREEIEEVTKREGWTKAGFDQMHKLDSFVKESQRLHPPGTLQMGRIALVDYTFSDGTSIPAGTAVAISSTSVHHDPATYEDPLRFDGFRFLKMQERAVLGGRPDKRFDMVSITSEFVAFGQGRHACPGRFFAASEIKLLLAYIVMTYDVKLGAGNVRPDDLVYMNSIRPDPDAEVYFRKRQ